MPLNSTRSSLALQPLADARLDEGPFMIVRSPGRRLDGDTGLAGWRRWNGRLRRRRQRLLCDVIGDGQSGLAPAAARAQLGRAEDDPRPLADKPSSHVPAASAASGEHATVAPRAADGALSDGLTLPCPGAGPSPRSPQRSPSGREVAAAWLLCVVIAVLALGATGGLHNSEPPAATVAKKTAILGHMPAVCALPLRCAEGGTAIFGPL